MCARMYMCTCIFSNTCGLFFWLVALQQARCTYKKYRINKGLTSWKHARLKQAQKEARSQQSRVILHHALQNSRDAQQKHIQRQPCRRSKLLEEHVGRNLKEDVGHEEDDYGGVEARRRVEHIEVFAEVVDLGVGNIDAVYSPLLSCGINSHVCICFFQFL